MMKNMYSVKELAILLGCSNTAIIKKIKPAEDGSDKKRYRGVYETVIENGKMYILLDDEELESEKKLSKGFNNVNNTFSNKNYEETLQDNNVIDVEYYRQNPINNANNASITVSEVFERLQTAYERFQERYENVCNELTEAKQNQKLLEDKASREGLYLNEIKELQSRNETLMNVNKTEIENIRNVYEDKINVLKNTNERLNKRLINVIICLLIILISTIVFLIYKLNTPTIIEKNNTIETIREVSVPVNAAENKNTSKTTRK